MHTSAFPKPLTLLAAFALCAITHAAHGHDFCVSTAAGLQQALTDSSDGGPYVDEYNFIDVVALTYKTGAATGNKAFHYQNLSSAGALILTGGWNSNCSVRVENAALTVLDGNHATQVLSLRQAANQLIVASLTIQNGETTLKGGGLTMNFVAGDASEVTLAGNIFRNNHTTEHNGGFFVNSALFIKNNLVTGNSADSGHGAGGINAGNQGAEVYNNTVVNNTTTNASGIGGLYFDAGSASGYINNNIFLNNTNYGIYLASGNNYLQYNDYGTRGGVTPVAMTGNVSVYPRYVDAAGGNFHLAGDSPLLAFSPLPVRYMVGPDGNVGPASGKTDVGAYFETIFSDGFDAN